MSILAHIVLGGSQQNEPAATQALAYILNAGPDIVRAFVGILRDANVEFEPGRVEAESAHEEAQPDLTIRDSNGYVRAFVENKFWAGLTEAQPVSYLEKLPENPPSALLFVVPQQRVSTVWNELRARCSEAGLDWVEADGRRAAPWARIGCKTIMIASWNRILERLLDAADSGERDDVRRDILQLRGLTSQIDSESFLPLRADEVNDQETARRMIGYNDLIEEIATKLRENGIADTSRLNPAHTYHATGRYLRVYGKIGLWFGIELEVWRDAGMTPLWWRIENTEFYGAGDRFDTIPDLFDDVKSCKGKHYLPIRLKTGVERDRVVEDAVAQMTRIANTLREAFSGIFAADHDCDSP